MNMIARKNLISNKPNWLISFVFYLILLSSQQALYAQDNSQAESENITSTTRLSDTLSQIQQLPAPTISVENPVESDETSIDLSWDIMDEASSYLFELCNDNLCTEPEITRDDLSEAKVSLSKLKIQQYFWRVSSVDSRGIVGIPSSAQPLIILSKSEGGQQAASNSSNNNFTHQTITDRLKQWPWYVWLVVLAYLLFLLRVINWFFSK